MRNLREWEKKQCDIGENVTYSIIWDIINTTFEGTGQIV